MGWNEGEAFDHRANIGAVIADAAAGGWAAVRGEGNGNG